MNPEIKLGNPVKCFIPHNSNETQMEKHISGSGSTVPLIGLYLFEMKLTIKLYDQLHHHLIYDLECLSKSKKHEY